MINDITLKNVLGQIDLYLCGENTSFGKDLVYENILEFFLINKIPALMSEVYKSDYANMPFWLKSFFDSVCYLNSKKIEKERQIIEKLDQTSIPYLLQTSGILLDKRFYNKAAQMITSKDLDILVAEKDLEEVNNFLHSESFTTAKLVNEEYLFPSRKEQIFKRLSMQTLPSYFFYAENHFYLQIDIQFEGKEFASKYELVKSHKYLEFYIKNTIKNIYYSETNAQYIRHNKGVLVYRYILLAFLIKDYFRSKKNILKLENLNKEEIFVINHLEKLFPHFYSTYVDIKVGNFRSEDSLILFNNKPIGKWKVDFLHRLNSYNLKKITDVNWGSEERFENYFDRKANK